MNVMDLMDGKAKEAIVPLMFAKVFDGEEGISLRRDVPAARREVRDHPEEHLGDPDPGGRAPGGRRHASARGYALAGTSARVNTAARKYEELVSMIIEMASTQIRVKRLGDEIRKTTRRVNALEQAIIPRAGSQVRYIRQALEEREREDTFRLKRLKKITSKKKKK